MSYETPILSIAGESSKLIANQGYYKNPIGNDQQGCGFGYCPAEVDEEQVGERQSRLTLALARI